MQTQKKKKKKKKNNGVSKIRSVDRSPTEDEASRERTIAKSEVGQQGGVARRQTMPGKASQEEKKKNLSCRSASRSDAAAGRRKGQATSGG